MMRNRFHRLAICFGVLDILTLLALIPKIIAAVFFLDPEVGTPLVIAAVVELLFYVSLACTSYGFFRLRRWAAIVYYVQLPLRVLFEAPTLRFIPVLLSLLGAYQMFYRLLNICVVLELVRLIATVVLHRYLSIRSSELSSAGAAGSRSP